MNENLSDIERKIKRIIETYQLRKGRMPNYEELERFTGRDKKDLQEILKKLGYLK